MTVEQVETANYFTLELEKYIADQEKALEQLKETLEDYQDSLVKLMISLRDLSQVEEN